MDDSTLASLRTAFDVAPSGELAKLIVLATLEREENSELLKYVPYLHNILSADESDSLAMALLNQGCHDGLVDFLCSSEVEDAHRCLQMLTKSSRAGDAKALYSALIERDIAFKSSQLDHQFDLQESPVKLKVVEKPDIASITDLTRYRERSTDFSDVVGLEEIKKQINKKIIMPFQRPALFARFKKKIGGGVILFGPPGCGKTLLARATAGECNASFFNIEVSDVLDMYIGESEQKLHAIFEKARSEKPSVLFFDELEALAGKREHARSNSSANTVSQFLTELDGFSQNNEGVLVLGSTNVPWAIDSAFLRPGRFDRMFFVPPPDVVAREGILQHHSQGRPGAESINFEAIAKITSGYSGADLENLIETAADEAIDASLESGRDVEITMSNFKHAVKECRATTIEWLTTARNYARYANDGGRYDDVLAFLKKHGKG